MVLFHSCVHCSSLSLPKDIARRAEHSTAHQKHVSDHTPVQACGIWLRRPYCPAKWALHHMSLEGLFVMHESCKQAMMHDCYLQLLVPVPHCLWKHHTEQLHGRGLLSTHAGRHGVLSNHNSTQKRLQQLCNSTCMWA